MKLKSGWRIEEHWKPTDRAGTRAGFVDVDALVAESPGDSLQLDFEGTGIGVFVASGPDTGRVEFRIDGGKWQTLELFTLWSPGLHLPWAKMISSELADGKHFLEMRVRDDSDARSKGHAVRIMHFLINGSSK